MLLILSLSTELRKHDPPLISSSKWRVIFWALPHWRTGLALRRVGYSMLCYGYGQKDILVHWKIRVNEWGSADMLLNGEGKWRTDRRRWSHAGSFQVILGHLLGQKNKAAWKKSCQKKIEVVASIFFCFPSSCLDILSCCISVSVKWERCLAVGKRTLVPIAQPVMQRAKMKKKV